uniref:CPG4 domain-containing protein n=1 Tax=Fibrocapsa japonica TaxID=94617 RepID=A0A7S2V3J0_9STRA|mmetsp:Transcript_23280/g.33844  ORF Transcript_23280/g.33844 Transcript_23280/m.33844 type:complete len:170 (+) Transcript_23280:26-535(+)
MRLFDFRFFFVATCLFLVFNCMCPAIFAQDPSGTVSDFSTTGQEQQDEETVSKENGSECEKACWEILDEEEILEVAGEKCEKLPRIFGGALVKNLCVRMFQEVVESACEHECDENIPFTKNNCMKAMREKENRRIFLDDGEMACRLGRRSAIQWASQIYKEEYVAKDEL